MEEHFADGGKVFLANSIEVPFQSLHHELWGEHLFAFPLQVGDKVDEIPESKELLEFFPPHQTVIGGDKIGHKLQVPPEFRRRLVRGLTETALGQGHEVLLGHLRTKQADGTVGLGRVQDVVANGDERDFLLVKVEVEDLERLMALLGETGLVHEDHAIDGQRDTLVAALAVDSTREHGLYLVGGSASGALVELWVQGLEHVHVPENVHFGLLPLEVGQAEVKGECL